MIGSVSRRHAPIALLAIGLLALGLAAARTTDEWRQICGSPDRQKAMLAPLTDDELVGAQIEIEDTCARIDLPAAPVHDAADPTLGAAHSDWVFDARFSPDGKTVVSASRDGTVRVWDAETGMPVRRIVVAEDDGDDPYRKGVARQAIFVGDGSLVAAVSDRNPVRLIDLASGDFVGEVAVSAHETFGGRVAAGGGLLFGGGHREAVDAYDPQRLAVRYSLPGHSTDNFAFIAVSEAAGLVATGTEFWGSERSQSRVRLWTLEMGEEVSSFVSEGGLRGRGLAFSRDGTRLAVIGNGSAHVYSVADRSLTGTILVHPVNGIDEVAFTADGNGLITCYSHPILWDIAAGEKLRHFGPFTDRCNSVDISPDGRFAVTTSMGSDVRIWEIETGTFHRRLGINMEPPR